jgi:hypothetical protein
MSRPSSLPARALAAALAAAMLLAVVACGGGGSATKPAAGPILVLDVKIEQPDEQAAILGATLLLDGREVARFQQTRPEIAVVFSKSLEGVATGKHAVAVRIDAQATSPTVYVGGGFATYNLVAHPMPETSGTLATGDTLRFSIEL